MCPLEQMQGYSSSTGLAFVPQGHCSTHHPSQWQHQSIPCPANQCSGRGLHVLPPSLPGKTPTYSVEVYVILSLSWLPDNYRLKKKKLFLSFSSSTLASFQVNSSVWFTHLCWESPGSSYSRTVILRAKLKRCNAKLRKGKVMWAKSRANQAQALGGCHKGCINT